MSIKAPQVFTFVACAAGMVGVLSVVRTGFRDQADDAFWRSLSGAGDEVAEMRAEEAETLHGGALPIDQAMSQFAAKGRDGFSILKSESGEGIAPVAGWIHHPSFDDRAAQVQAFTGQEAAPEEEEGEADEAATDEAATEPAEAAE